MPRSLKPSERFGSSNIHCFWIDDHGFIYDAPSGSLHVVDQEAWTLTRHKLLTGHWAGTGSAAELELRELAKAGLLNDSDPLNSHPPDTQPLPTKALCFNVAHACNMSCEYCFAGQGDFGGVRHRHPTELVARHGITKIEGCPLRRSNVTGSISGDDEGVMKPQTARAAIDFLLRSSQNIKHLEVDFFGGEPLLAMDTIRETVSYGQEAASRCGKSIQFTITTNGVLLDESVRQFMNENKILAVLSLDGRPEIHNRMRHLRRNHGSSPSYDLVLPHFQQLAENREQDEYYVRGTYTRFNLDFASDVLHLLDLGFDSVSVEPVVEPDTTRPYALCAEDLQTIEAEYFRLADLLAERSVDGKRPQPRFFHFQIDLNGGPCVGKLVTGCGAGHQYLAVTPAGELYPCHQFVGKAEFRLGSVYHGIDRPQISRMFAAANALTKPACRSCWARYLCGGGCHAQAFAFNQDLLQPYHLGCQLMRLRLEAALYYQYRLAQET